MRSKRAKLTEEFVHEVSCDGLKHLYDSTHKLISFLWLLLVLAATGALLWQFILRFQDYFHYDVSTQTTEEHVSSLAFPAITICNMNRFFNLTYVERSFFNTISSVYDYPNSSQSQESIDNAIQYFNQQGAGSNFTNYLISKSWQFNSPGTVVLCSIGFRTCTASNFFPTFTTDTGLCWTVNSNSVQEKKGIENGFHILLNVDQLGYSENLIRGHVGVLFRVHPFEEPAQVGLLGKAIGVGNWGLVSIHKQQLNHIHTPWGQCREDQKPLLLNSVYTEAACYKECIDQRVIASCQCRDPVVYGFTDARECTPEEVLKCAAPNRFTFETIINPSDCGCFQACNEDRYKTSISYTTFPSQRVVRELQLHIGTAITLDYMRENYVGLSVFFDRLSVTKVVESKALSESALLSDLGGQLGLWVGMSVITIFQFLQYFVQLCFPRTYKKTSPSDADKETRDQPWKLQDI